MKASQSLHLKQSQTLVMTQQLQQSIKLLQLSSLELTEFVDQEIEKNPLLNHDEGQGDASLEAGDKRDESNESQESVESASDVDVRDQDASSEMMDANYGEGW
ncbi:MAG: hypothetical protein MRY32_09255, partial [Rickettsiales bacterium]|nr:hypothetical protein [Rickettsiales bacterium]